MPEPPSVTTMLLVNFEAPLANTRPLVPFIYSLKGAGAVVRLPLVYFEVAARLRQGRR